MYRIRNRMTLDTERNLFRRLTIISHRPWPGAERSQGLKPSVQTRLTQRQRAALPTTGGALKPGFGLEWGISTAGESVPAARSRFLVVHSQSIWVSAHSECVELTTTILAASDQLPQGLKPASELGERGAEAPLFHGMRGASLADAVRGRSLRNRRLQIGPGRDDG